MYTKKALSELIVRLAQIVSKEISINALYLFGSYASGKPRVESDVDIAIVSDDFQGIRFYDRQRIIKLLVNATYPHYQFADVEIHPFKTEHFTSSDPFVAEIIQKGKRIV
jgi:predicted nucleotidyltransferase